jgi:putrescine transport system ATP-binding protein
MAALDRKLREETQLELMAIQRRLGLTFMIVTHDQDEAMVVADRMAVLREGRVVQVGSPRDVYERPADAYVAGFIGEVNLFETPAGLRAVRPEKMTLAAGGEARVAEIAYLGDRTRYVVEAGRRLLVSVPGPPAFRIGGAVTVGHPPEAAVEVAP